MQSTAQGYLIFQLTKSPIYLGYVGFAAGLPALLFTLYGGVIADRISRRTMMLFTQSSMMVLAFLLAGLVFTGTIQPWMIIILAFLLGIANAFDAPARVSFVVELVDREDLTNGIALNATMFNLATVFGPAVAGITYAAFGPAWCFAINGISFIAVIIALLLMHLKPIPVNPKRNSVLEETKEGFRAVASSRTILIMIAGMGVMSLFGLSLMTLLPAWVSDVLNGNSKLYGLLLSGRGLGALIGGLMIAYLGRYKIRGKLWTIGDLSLPLTIAAFALVQWIPLSLFLITLSGWSFMVQVNTANAIVQTRVDDALRGRVMGIYSLVFFGGMPIGALLVGGLAQQIGEANTLLICAAVMFVFALFVYLRMPFLRTEG
ncbi:MAG: major facilitator superfamily 1 [Chloroflexi bacterium]|nr:major facilitator superfamily 1 [Chloroflexota bacterium]